jgi:cell division septation protein DedD
MKTIGCFSILFILVSIIGCSSSKQQSTDGNGLKEKESFTFDEIKSDSSAPLPIDSSAVEGENNEIQKNDIPAFKSRKKPMDQQESPISSRVKNKIFNNDTLSQKPASENASVSEEPKVSGYVVQLGAFQSSDNAKEFVKLNKSKVKHEMNVRYSERVKLYVVQLLPFDSRTAAQNVVKELKRRGYKDAFLAPSAE